MHELQPSSHLAALPLSSAISLTACRGLVAAPVAADPRGESLQATAATSTYKGYLLLAVLRRLYY